MARDWFGFPDSPYGWSGLISGVIGAILYFLQIFTGWFGIDEADKTMFSVLVITLICWGTASYIVANRLKSKKGKRMLESPIKSLLKIFALEMVLVFLVIFILNWQGMMLSLDYADYTADKGGLVFGIRQLTYITTDDVNSLTQWSIGVQQLIKGLFLIVPFLIATWGGLSVLTADSIDEAEGGILALVSAFVVVIIVWIFKLVGVILGTA